MLKIGDKVMWRGAWGMQPPLEATIESMQLCAVGQKYGKDINSCKWKTVRNGKIVVTLDNGHWAYGTQLDPIEK
jgi:hypothetical protein